MSSLLDKAYPQKTQWSPPTQSELAAKAEYFLKSCRPKEYREAKKSGELQEWVNLKVSSAQRYAQNLIETGESTEVAWDLAVRSRILEQAEA